MMMMVVNIMILIYEVCIYLCICIIYNICFIYMLILYLVGIMFLMCFLLDFDWKQDARLRMTLTNLCDSRRGEGLEGSLASMEALLQFHSRAVLWCPMASGTATFRQGTSENGEFAIYFTNVLAIFVP